MDVAHKSVLLGWLTITLCHRVTGRKFQYALSVLTQATPPVLFFYIQQFVDYRIPYHPSKQDPLEFLVDTISNEIGRGSIHADQCQATAIRLDLQPMNHAHEGALQDLRDQLEWADILQVPAPIPHLFL